MENGLLLVLGAMTLAMLAVALLRRSQFRTATARDLTREQLARLRDQQQIQKSLEELLLQLEEFSKRIDAQIEQRSADLKTILENADARLGALREQMRAIDAARSAMVVRDATRRTLPESAAVIPPPRAGVSPGDTGNPGTGATVRGSTKALTRVSPPTVEGVVRASVTPAPLEPGLVPAKPPATAVPPKATAMATQPVSAAVERGQAGTGALGRPRRMDGSASPEVTVVGAPLSPAERKRQVYQLADGGAGPMAIAERLRMSLGEVELLLNLRGFARPRIEAT